MMITKESKAVKDIANAFLRRGYEFYLVGGYVRDKILGEMPMDVDAATNARPQEIKAVLTGEDVDAIYTMGEKYGTIGCKSGGYDFEITTFRGEQYREGSRKPEVRFSDSIEYDLRRRDFTINAMAIDMMDETLVDLNGGLWDLKQGIIRAVGNPAERFRDDPLRIVRAIRFAGKYNAVLENNTYAAILADVGLVNTLSMERIRDELNKILLLDSTLHALDLLMDTGIMDVILPEISKLEGVEQNPKWHKYDVFGHTGHVVDSVHPSVEMRLAALLHDTGKWDTMYWRGNFYGHEDYSVRHVHNIMRRLRYPNKSIQKVAHMVRMHMRPMQLYRLMGKGELTSKAVRRFIRDCYIPGTCDVHDVMELNKADLIGHGTDAHKDWPYLNALVQAEEDAKLAQSPLDGRELMRLFDNKPAGAWIAKVKKRLENAVVDGELAQDDKEKAKEIARTMVERDV